MSHRSNAKTSNTIQEFLFWVGIDSKGGEDRIHINFSIDGKQKFRIAKLLKEAQADLGRMLGELKAYASGYARDFGSPLRIRYENGKLIDSSEQPRECGKVVERTFLERIFEILNALALETRSLLIGKFQPAA